MLVVRARSARVAVRLALALFTAAADARAQGELDLLARRIPSEWDAAAEARSLVALAEASGLVDVRVDSSAPVPGELARFFTERGARTSGHELTALGTPGDAAALLERLPLLPLPVVAGSYEIAESSPHGVRLTARLVFPVLDPYEAGLDATRALLELCDRPASTRGLAAHATLAGGLESDPAAITKLRFLYPDIVGFDAVAVGAGTEAGVVQAWGAAGVEEVHVERSESGDCRLLSGRGRLAKSSPTEAPESIAAALSDDLFVPPDDAACLPPPAARSVRASARGDGTIASSVSLRARGATRAETLRLVGRATGRPTIGWGDESASVELDLESVTAEEAIQALAAAGAPLRRHAETLVWGEPPLARAPDLPYQGIPVSFDLACAGLDDVLAIFSDLTGLTFDVEAPLGDCVDLRAYDRPWDEVLDALLAATRLEHAIDGTTVRLRPVGDRPAEPPTRNLVALRWWPPLDRLDLADLRLVGVVRTLDGWRALVRAPLGRSYELAAGDAVAGGRVVRVDDGGATVALAGREVRLALPAPGAPPR